MSVMRHRRYRNFVIYPLRNQHGAQEVSRTLAYVNSIWRIVDNIHRIRTGRIVLEAIQGTNKRFRFTPYNRATGEPPNAFALPDDWQDATPNRRPALSCGGPNTGRPIHQWSIFGSEFGQVSGTGEGSHVSVAFSAGMWRRRSDWGLDADSGLLYPLPPGPAEAPAGPGSTRDEILLHELLHGFRMASGTLHCSATNMGHYDTFEEFFAIVVANMYMSQISGTTDTPLRAHHHGFTVLPFTSLFPDDRQNQIWLAQINRQHSSLITRLAMEVEAPFNPFRDLYRRDAVPQQGPVPA